MGILDALLGNASEVDISKVQEELAPILADCEEVQLVYKLIRDMYVFTQKRLILIDKQGITGRKTEYHSVPYKSISHFVVETAGHFDLDAELKIWLSSSQEPLIKELKGSSDVIAVQKALATFMFV